MVWGYMLYSIGLIVIRALPRSPRIILPSFQSIGLSQTEQAAFHMVKLMTIPKSGVTKRYSLLHTILLCFSRSSASSRKVCSFP